MYALAPIKSGSILDFKTEMDRQMDRLIDSFFGSSNFNVTPAMEVIDEDDKIRLRLETPGLSKDDIKVTVNDGIITIAGEKKQCDKVKQNDYYLSEIRYGKFSRSFTLPSSIKADDIEAELKDGVLNVVLKKDTSKPKAIEVKVV